MQHAQQTPVQAHTHTRPHTCTCPSVTAAAPSFFRLINSNQTPRLSPQTGVFKVLRCWHCAGPGGELGHRRARQRPFGATVQFNYITARNVTVEARCSRCPDPPHGKAVRHGQQRLPGLSLLCFLKMIHSGFPEHTHGRRMNGQVQRSVICTVSGAAEWRSERQPWDL